MYRTLTVLFLSTLLGCGATAAHAQRDAPQSSSTTEAPVNSGTASKPEPVNGATPVASGGPQTPPKAMGGDPSANAFRLVALTDMIWLPNDRIPEYADQVGTRLFQVFRGAEGPKDGFFGVGGKPVAPVFKSSNPSVLDIGGKPVQRIVRASNPTSLALLEGKTYAEAGQPDRASIRGPGKTTVTVSIGDRSVRADLDVLTVPVSSSMSRHDLLGKHGYPARKYLWPFGAIPAGFEELPRGCCGIQHWSGFRNQGTDVVPWRLSGKRQQGLSRDDVAGEYWEYPQWPRCLILVGEEGVKSIVTRPAEKTTAPGHPTAKPPAEPEPKPAAAQKTFSVTYRKMHTKGHPLATDLIYAASAEEAKKEVLKTHPFAKFEHIEEK